MVKTENCRLSRTATQSFFSHFICHLQGFGTYSVEAQ